MGILSFTKNSGRRIGALVIATVVVCMMALVAASSVLATQAQAKLSEPYNYTVRIFAGAQGSFDGQNSIVRTVNPEPGTVYRISFNQGSVTLDDGSKYYIRGIREAGRDNDTSLTTPSFVITGDTDLVVSYGVLGDNVKYTVQYVDEDGNALLPSETFYGNVGDSPVIAYRYIEGYTPQAYNLTGKLLADETKNVYTFTYTAGEQPEAPAAQQPAPAIVAPVPGEGDAEPVATVVPEADIPDDANPLAGGDQPADIQDIRDDENPLAFFENLIGDEAGLVTLQEAAPLIAGLLGALILAIIILVIFRKRRKNQELAYQTARSEVMTNDGSNGTSKSDSSDNGSGGNGHTV